MAENDNDTDAGAGPESVKPTWRGVSHHWAALAGLGAGIVLVGMAPTTRSAWAAAIFAASVVILFSVSASYHRRTWAPRSLALLRGLDHASIFVLIAGSYTPICLLGLPPDPGTKILAAVWGAAALGALKSVFWARAPRILSSALYVLVGWLVVPYFGELRASLTTLQLALLVGGGVVYSAGALVYAARRPNLVKDVFGYHEIFHILTIVACGMHFAMVIGLVQAAR
jgi:hemolysin III